MKNINFKFIGILLLVVLALGSCKKWIDPNVNISPDAPPEADISTILSYAEVNMAYNTVGGNDLARVTAIWMQYIAGMARQSRAEQNYLWYNSDDNNLWASNYSTTMADLKKIIEKADAKIAGAPADQTVGHVYKGIAEVLLANALGVTTDVWGDIPYSQAFQGSTNLQPGFDSQEKIYTTIQDMLTDAISNLRLTTSTAQRDFIYGGDAALWTEAAWALKARYALHLSKIDPANAYKNALAMIDSGAIASNADDLQFVFSGMPYSNPFFNFEYERGDVQMHSTLIDTLIGRQDPRLPAYADPSGPDFIGAGFGYTGDGSEIAWPGVAVAYEASPVQFITYTELLFIKAEAKLKIGTGTYPMSEVKNDLVAAVTASMDKWGVYDATYMTFYDAAIQAIPDAAVDVIFTEIMRQKWIAMYCQLEAYNDWRRTNNVIALTANPDGVKVEIPRRYPYPVDEVTYNSNTPVVADIWQRVWWDKAK
ncbi:MAG: SusD/RagB family nutrient-binding outer membrane lipoprotein [Bacteroidetes bacterium]|nr:SusD/RagB family nutrient-binding outer membrane lipoprotein [Bacteroidota bacterium]